MLHHTARLERQNLNHYLTGHQHVSWDVFRFVRHVVEEIEHIGHCPSSTALMRGHYLVQAHGIQLAQLRDDCELVGLEGGLCPLSI